MTPIGLFTPGLIGTCTIRNRIIRSATFESLCDPDGLPGDAYIRIYEKLAHTKVGAIITGFTYISTDGKAMQPGQAGLDKDENISAFRRMTEAVHAQGCPIFIQLAHSGRQTTSKAAGGKVYGPSPKPSRYFRSKPDRLSQNQTEEIIKSFADTAARAKLAGFDGVQLHAAHGYLIHQFILPAINDRDDKYGIDPVTGIGTAFMDAIIAAVRMSCGPEYPILVKISGGDDYRVRFTTDQFINLVKFLDRKNLAAIEVSYGTMDWPLNIFRGKSVPIARILDYNPRYRQSNRLIRKFWRLIVLPLVAKRLKPFTPMYNLPYARLAKQHTAIPIITVGGFRSRVEMATALKNNDADFISLCRPFIRETGFADRLAADPEAISLCIDCNSCAAMCDSGNPTRCYVINEMNEKENP